MHSVLQTRFCRRAFTLIELLVVIAIIALLLGIIVPVLKKTKQKARLLVCSSNLASIGKAIHAYAADNKDAIPLGPKARLNTGSDLYPSTGCVTSLLSRLGDGAPVGLGLLLDSYLSSQPKVLFCPAADQLSEADKQLALVGENQAQGDYYYRHGSVTAMEDDLTRSVYIRLSNLGKNRSGRSITALVMDVQFLAHPSLTPFGVVTRTNHDRKISNILFADGQVVSQDNTDGRFTVDIGISPYDGLDKILKVFELADEYH